MRAGRVLRHLRGSLDSTLEACHWQTGGARAEPAHVFFIKRLLAAPGRGREGGGAAGGLHRQSRINSAHIYQVPTA